MLFLSFTGKLKTCRTLHKFISSTLSFLTLLVKNQLYVGSVISAKCQQRKTENFKKLLKIEKKIKMCTELKKSDRYQTIYNIWEPLHMRK